MKFRQKDKNLCRKNSIFFKNSTLIHGGLKNPIYEQQNS